MSISLTNFNQSFCSFIHKAETPWDLINEILKAGNFEEEFDNDIPPLIIAVKMGNYELFKKLIDLGESIYIENTPFENTTLALALDLEQEDIALLLIRMGFPLNLSAEDGESFLHKAAARGSMNVCRALIEKGMNVNYFYYASHNGLDARITAVSSSILQKKTEVSQFLISLLKPETINQELDSEKTTLLHLASRMSEFVTCKTLLEFGADPNLRDIRGDAPIFTAILKKSKPLCELLFKYGANPNFKINEGLMTPLHFAACLKLDEEFINCLLINGADARALTIKGQTPLDILSRDFNLKEKYAMLVEKDQGLTQTYSKLIPSRSSFFFEGTFF